MHQIWNSLSKSLLIIIVVGTRSASAQFLSNYTSWQEISQAQQWAFVSGVVDHALVFVSPENVQGAALSNGLAMCAYKVHFTNQQVAQVVSDTYRNNPQIWGVEPAAVTWYAIVRICQSELNDQLNRAGLPLISADNLLQNFARRPAILGVRP